MIDRKDTGSIGQAMEFRVWTELIQQSRGQLHVFLPLLDRGLDAVDQGDGPRSGPYKDHPTTS